MITCQSSSLFGTSGMMDEASSSTSNPPVPRLVDLCRRVLKANVAHLVDVGDVPYSMIKDILPGCRVEQLREIEELSPHIAEEDEEIWEYFFKRDFPIVAEMRAKAAQERTQNSVNDRIGSSSSIHTTKGPPRASSYAETDSQDAQMDDDLFVSYRDLYYDEQVRREEKLASAGERLKERMNSLAQMKSSRQTILDPRLSLNLRKRKRGQTLPTGRTHWSKESRPKTLTEKAKARASQLAFAYDPPRFTRSSSMKVGFIPPKPRPMYKEASLDDSHTASPRKVGIFGPRRGKHPLEACQGPTEAFVRKTGSSHSKPTSFVERTVARPVKSSPSRPYRAHAFDAEITMAKAAPYSKSPQLTQSASGTPQTNNSFDTKERTRPSLSIPGITRRPLPPKKISEQNQPVTKTSIAVSPTATPTTSSAAASAPPSSGSPAPASDLPMLSQPRKALPSGPSLFIPRKRTKLS